MRNDKFPSAVVCFFLFNFAQCLSGMRRDNRNYFLRLRICLFGRDEKVVLRYAEGCSCFWTTSTLRLWHRNQNGEEGQSVHIKAFLEEMLVRHGKRSVYFVKKFPFLF